MAEELKHPQITDDQLELWLAHPATRAFLSCIGWAVNDSIEAAGSGKLVDSSSADLTHALLHRALGEQDGLRKAADPARMLEYYNMIFYPPNEEETEDGGNAG